MRPGWESFTCEKPCTYPPPPHSSQVKSSPLLATLDVEFKTVPLLAVLESPHWKGSIRPIRTYAPKRRQPMIEHVEGRYLHMQDNRAARG